MYVCVLYCIKLYILTMYNVSYKCGINNVDIPLTSFIIFTTFSATKSKMKIKELITNFKVHTTSS